MEKTTDLLSKKGLFHLEATDYHLPMEGIDPIIRNELIKKFKKYIDIQKGNFLGYQANQDIEFKSETADFLNCHVNNIGDPFTNGNFTINSKIMEKAVLDYYAKLWNAKLRKEPTPLNPTPKQDLESYWGYVLTMGSSEGNIYGLWNARDYLAGRQLQVDPKKPGSTNYLQPKLMPSKNGSDTGINAYTPVAFFSEDTHYSITKFMRVLGINTFCEIGEKYYKGQNPIAGTGGDWKKTKEVPSKGGNTGPGSVDIDKLEQLVRFFAEKGYPILIVCNFGSTFKGAYDDVESVQNRLMPIFKTHGLIDRKVTYIDDYGKEAGTDIRNGYWIHVDGALGSSYMPFVEMAYNKKKIVERGPNFDFRLPGVCSIVMSGHKWPGAPWPCGIFMTKHKYQLFPPDDPEYIGSPDTTFSGSRNGYSSIIMWDYLAKNSYNEQIDRVVKCERIIKYAELKLFELQKKINTNLYINRTPLSLTVRFRKPNDTLVAKYSLSCETLMIDGTEREYAHIYAMPLVDEKLIDKFILDLQTDNAFEKEDIDKKSIKFSHSSAWK